MSYTNTVEFSVLKGKTLVEIDATEGQGEVVFTTDDGLKFKLYHSQDCCEHVAVESIVGNLSDLLGTPIISAEEVSSNEHPEGYKSDGWEESFTWTFYKLATIKGYVDIRWLGSSNGYYSESVTFIKVTH